MRRLETKFTWLEKMNLNMRPQISVEKNDMGDPIKLFQHSNKSLTMCVNRATRVYQKQFKLCIFIVVKRGN